MLQYDFENSVGCWLALTSQAIRRDMANEMAREDITSRQWEVLCWVAMEGELSQTELSERIGIEAPTLVGILDRMERDGWLERYACPKDRRRKRMRVTPKAEAVWERIVACAQRVRSRATEGISSEELEVLRGLCERIRANLESPEGKIERPSDCQIMDSSADIITQGGCPDTLETSEKPLSRTTAR